ncbi:proline-rich protein 2-like [Neovison vison]|uniref:proline-rich protein 2-like n=1 Tax=Neovison vison TaxID=452646 RepID=UPI001CEFE15B|nr:proline-rich protein 2-like [Neogale vison]
MRAATKTAEPQDRRREGTAEETPQPVAPPRGPKLAAPTRPCHPMARRAPALGMTAEEDRPHAAAFREARADTGDHPRGVRSRLRDSGRRSATASLHARQRFRSDKSSQRQPKRSRGSLPSLPGARTSLRARVRGRLTQTPVPPRQDAPSKPQGGARSAVETPADVDRRDPRGSRDARRGPDGPEPRSRGASPPQTGPQAGGDRRGQTPRSPPSPVLYRKARRPAKAGGGGERRTHLAGTLGDRLPCPRDARRTLPAFANAPPPAPGPPPRSAPTWQPQPLPAAGRRFRERRLAPPTPARGPLPHFRERRLAPPTPARGPLLHFRERRRAEAESGCA